ncbi:hypothetical protein L9F63_018117, partial [Diploptera punctata]
IGLNPIITILLVEATCYVRDIIFIRELNIFDLHALLYLKGIQDFLANLITIFCLITKIQRIK